MILYLSVKQRDINILIAAPNGIPKHNEGKKGAERKRRLKMFSKRKDFPSYHHRFALKLFVHLLTQNSRLAFLSPR